MEIEQKIRKLLSLAKSANEHEAALAAEKASELALKHNIDLLQFQTNPSDYKDNSVKDSTKNELWVTSVMQAVAKLNACKFYVEVRNKGFRYRLVGKEHNIHITESISDYLLKTIKRLNTQQWKEYQEHYNIPPLLKPEMRRDFRKSFRLGASANLCRRLNEKYENLRTKSTEQTTALVVANYFDQEQNNIEIHLNAEGIELEPTKHRKPKLSDAYCRGYDAAEDINLEEQIDGVQSPRLTGA